MAARPPPRSPSGSPLFVQFWDALSPREQARLSLFSTEWQRLHRTSMRAYELGRLREAELLDEAAELAAHRLEGFLEEVESESEAHTGDESDVLQELAALYETHLDVMAGRRPGAYGPEMLDRVEVARVARMIVEDWAGGQRVRGTEAEAYDAAIDAWERVRRLRRVSVRRDAGRCFLARAAAARRRARLLGVRALLREVRAR